MTQDSTKPKALSLARTRGAPLQQPELGDLLGKAYEHVLNGVCCSRIVFNGDEPVDRLYLYTNPAFSTQTGMQNVVGRLASELRSQGEPVDPDLLFKLARIARTGESEIFEYFERPTGRWFSMSAYSPMPDHVVSICDNITERKRMELERENYRQILERRVEEQMQELRESEERYRGLFESLPVGIIVQAANGEIIDVNQAACDILRISMDQFCGMTGLDPAWTPVHEDGSPFPGEEHPAMAALATGQPQLGVIMGLGNVNDRTWIGINSHPLFRKGHTRPYSVLSSFLDISRRMRNEEVTRALNQRYQDLLASSTEVAIIASDVNGVITLFNAGAERLLGYRENEVVGRVTPNEFHSPEQMDAAAVELGQELGTPLDGLHAILATVEKEGRFHRQWIYRRKDGSDVRASVWITPVRNAQGELTGHLAVIQRIGGCDPS